ncbi:bifunctional adenosylcobinamide kinase/adenosylcobinamide-phosphate guanylyltransferase [Metabacillus idriensis]|uniref:bifunctional adenosylcobinamide kinase/adenosylcobinamide-phosphate guanylyltransferase n=1 Tax=Metabacillus idriensis TaxID=324768 RepID=UPI002814203D|nr:bifunctional adenosylcobinamide kinase/adenosylcobinamide-phosphate guanylyltransferase [Metabacillus idriensis]MDR0137514.1 bifunctional adenosylcobinamide kinase/adenosylcobinamide-phosphate guanylyltransferase [Metabacillus idriensis]
MITFISGGARSGKSSLAERMALDAAKGEKPCYIATAAKDTGEEMAERIALHKRDRGDAWVTIEEPYFIDQTLKHRPNKAVILIDCLTVWTSNLMFSENLSSNEIVKRLEKTLSIARKKEFNLFIVSNDVNEGFPIQDKDVANYISCLEALHKLTVKEADKVLEVICGIPVAWKINGGLTKNVSMISSGGLV